tara:strand:+ start:12762 stop:13445 length:684 start_codon:yes stop_codon:yes gene_type:complete
VIGTRPNRGHEFKCKRILLVIDPDENEDSDRVKFYPTYENSGFQLRPFTMEFSELSTTIRTNGNVYIDQAVLLQKYPYSYIQLMDPDVPGPGHKELIFVSYTYLEIIDALGITRVKMCCRNCYQTNPFKLDYSTWNHADADLHPSYVKDKIKELEDEKKGIRFIYPFATLPKDIWLIILKDVIDDFIKERSLLYGKGDRLFKNWVCDDCARNSPESPFGFQMSTNPY